MSAQVNFGQRLQRPSKHHVAGSPVSEMVKMTKILMSICSLMRETTISVEILLVAGILNPACGALPLIQNKGRSCARYHYALLLKKPSTFH